MILITGATGLVGTHLLAELLETVEPTMVKPIFRKNAKKNYTISLIKEVYGNAKAAKAEKCCWTKADILDIPSLIDAFEGIAYVYHCAGFISNSPTDRKKIRKTNIEGTKNVVNLALDFNIKKLLHVSSIATLGKPKNGDQINETHYKESLQNGSYYSLSKYGAEMEVWRANQEGLNCIIVNPGVILGEGFYSSGSGKVFFEANKNIPFYLPKKTGFTDVLNLVKTMCQLMQSNINNKRFIIVDKNESFGIIQKQIAEALGKRLPKIKLRKWMLYTMWLLELLLVIFRKRKLTLDVIDGLLDARVYENNSIKKHLGFTEADISERIKQIANHFKQAQ